MHDESKEAGEDRSQRGEKHQTGQSFLDRQAGDGWGSRSYHAGYGYDEIHDDSGERLLRREDVEKPLEPFFRSVFKIGPWWFTVLFYAVALAAIILLLSGPQTWGQGPQPDGHAHDHKEGFVKLPPDVAEHVKGGYTHATVGSRAWIRGDHGWTDLERGHRDDSKLIATDTEYNSFTIKVYARGCGRGWTTTDQNGANPGPGVRNTTCNMLYHQTGEEEINGGYIWTPPSYHKDPGDG